MASLDSTEKELKKEFSSLGIKVEEDQLLLCATMCKRCNVTPNYLVEGWIAFAFSNLSGDITPTCDNLLLMETKELSPKSNTIVSAKTIVLDDPPIDVKKPTKIISPKEVMMEVDETPNNVVTENKGRYAFPPEVVHSYGCEDKTNITSLDLKLLNTPNAIEDACLYNTLKDEANFLAEATFHIVDTITSNANILENENEEAGSYYSGRIVQTPDSRLNPNFIRMHNPEKGDYIVDVSRLNDYSLFPGQVILVKGIKSGTKITASHIYDNGRLPLSLYAPTVTGRTPILIAAGPFIEYPNDLSSLDYIVKLSGFLKPRAIVLLGPIINSKALQSESSLHFQQLFEEAIFYLNKNVDQSIKVYCVINKLDKCTIPVYPTLPLDMSLSKHVSLLPDPALVSMNGVTVALSSTDILLHMAKHEIQKNCSEKFVRLGDHCMKQQTLYPLYPTDISVGMDFKLWYKYTRFTHSPHIILFTSVFKYFVKESNGKHILINPGTMSPKKDTRTFALMELNNCESREWNPNACVSVKIFKA